MIQLLQIGLFLKNQIFKIGKWFLNLSWNNKLLIFVILFFVAFFVYHQYSIAKKDKRYKELFKQHLTQAEFIQEQKGIYSAKLIYLSELNSEDLFDNDALGNIISDRDQQITQYTKLVLQFQKQIIEIKNAKQKIIYKDREVFLSKECEEELKDKRFKVEFEKKQPPVSIVGYTLTNPPEAYLVVDFDKIELNLVMTEGDDGEQYYTTVDNENVIITSLSIIKKTTDIKWYQKLGVGVSLLSNLDNNILQGNLNYRISKKINLFVGGGRSLSTKNNYGLIGFDFFPFAK